MPSPTPNSQLPTPNNNLKVAIVCDWLIGGGAEQVVLELHRMFPDAPIYTSYCSNEWRQKLDGKVVTGYLQKWPLNKLRKFLPLLRQSWFKHLEVSNYDLVISSSGNGEAKFVQVKKPAVHICYCHTPTHFYWRNYEQYLENPGFNPKWLARLGLRFLVKPLRKRDYKAAQRVDLFIANSSHIRSDIKMYYGRESTVIHPPVDTDRFQTPNSQLPTPNSRQGFLTVGRQVPYKRHDLAVAACTQLNLPLTVIGNGPEHEKLRGIAGPSVTFVTNANDSKVAEYFASAEAFIFPGLDDFGITPVEAMAAGTPVIAYKAGGALDYVIPGKTGEFFEKQTPECLTEILRNFSYEKFIAAEIIKYAQSFNRQTFQEKIRAVISGRPT